MYMGVFILKAGTWPALACTAPCRTSGEQHASDALLWTPASVCCCSFGPEVFAFPLSVLCVDSCFLFCSSAPPNTSKDSHRNQKETSQGGNKMCSNYQNPATQTHRVRRKTLQPIRTSRVRPDKRTNLTVMQICEVAAETRWSVWPIARPLCRVLTLASVLHPQSETAVHGGVFKDAKIKGVVQPGCHSAPICVVPCCVSAPKRTTQTSCSILISSICLLT